MHGEWMGLLILRTSEPMLKAEFVSHPFLPQPFSTTVSIQKPASCNLLETVKLLKANAMQECTQSLLTCADS
jgi:hypothetical protein